MLRVLLLLGGLWGPGASLKKDSTRLHVQITVPEKISSLTSEGPESEVSYRIAVEGETYTVKLTQKSFLSRDFKVYGYDGAGIMKPLEEHIQNFCYYQGYVEGYPKSLVIISTCTGLRGLLQFENISYGIEPLESSVGFEHVLYQVKHENKSVSLHAEKEIDLKNKNYRIKSVKPSPEFPRYIEMHIIVEKNLYERMGADTATVTQKIFQLVGLMNAFFSSFNLTVILASLELWTDENKISTDGDINELLYNFQNWKKSYLVLRPHDVAFLLVYREASSYVGAIFQGMICDKDYGGGVALHPKIVSLDAFAVVLVQLVSLSMGISYDDTDRCPCPGAVCVMNPDAIHFSGVKVFSNCSKEDFVQFMSRQMSHCLQNQPPMELAYRAAPVCGNLVLEAGEDCDCGTQQECESITPVCCEAATCRLKASSQCAVGLCCDNCKFRPKGHTCRAAADECDLPEFCNGTSASCQEDFFIHNGHRCGGNKWVCIEGKCLTGKKQCAEAFGDESGESLEEGTNYTLKATESNFVTTSMKDSQTSACFSPITSFATIDFGTEECFEQLNSRSDITGNCGIAAPGMYTACPPGSRKCGKLICLYSKQEILQNRHAIIIYANIDGKICVSLEYTQDHSDSGRMWVKDGTVCGTKKVCRNKACVDDTYLDYDCTPDTCSRRGVCNNKKHCHCNARYLPPNCRNSDASSAGGSVDSGNARFEPIPERNYIESVYRTKPKKWPFFLVIPFFIILSVLVAIVVKVYYQRKKWKTEDYKSDEDLESESKSQNTKE